MKVKVLGIAVTGGILGAIWVLWCVLMNLVGVGAVPFEFIDQFYLGLLSPTIVGAILGLIFGFIDGFVLGTILAWIYNKIAINKV